MAIGTVLVVDDDPLVCEMLLSHFERGRIPAERELSAREARVRLERNSIALALIDIKMPIDDGHELAKWIRIHHPDVEIMLMSGDADPGIRAIGFPFIDKGGPPHIIIERALIYLELAALKKTTRDLPQQNKDAIALLDQRILTLNVETFMKNFVGHTTGKIVLALIAGILTYGATRAEHLTSQVNDLESAQRATQASIEATRQDLRILFPSLYQQKVK
jgi:CheY-like chemotaxis protein